MSNVDLHRRAHEEFNRGDVAAAASHLTPDAVYTDHARKLAVKGPDEFANWAGEWRTAMSDAEVTDPQYIDADEWSIARFVGRGTHDGPLAGIPATGRRIELDFCEMYRYDAEGRMVQGEMYYDLASLLAQVADSPQ